MASSRPRRSPPTLDLVPAAGLHLGRGADARELPFDAGELVEDAGELALGGGQLPAEVGFDEAGPEVGMFEGVHRRLVTGRPRAELRAPAAGSSQRDIRV